MQTEPRRLDPAGIAIGLALFALAGAVASDLTGLELTSTYGVGPKAMPIIVAGGLAILAIANLVTAWRGDLPERESYDPKPVVLILGGLAVLIAIIEFGGGFIPAIAVLFATTAAAFGRRAILTDLIIGVVLALIVFLLFSKLLTLSLPMGPLERLL
ncbi:MAG TPA: tripartite tricarboxylate transporter TctB family protein [Xanthobacteraceae bacterium]|nr:tripartite tricarboxylate transporter TctB family protein [Xanthobacteraceae bacterium]